MIEPNWDTAPAGDRYMFPDYSGFDTHHVLTPSGTRFFWNYIEGQWDKGFMKSVDQKLLKLIEEGLQPMATEVKFEAGDEVSFTGKIIETSGEEVFVRPSGGVNGQWVYKTYLTMVKKAEKPIPNHTVVTDSHGCEFILADNKGVKNWVRISSQESGKYVGQIVDYNSFAGQALQKIAREALSA